MKNIIKSQCCPSQLQEAIQVGQFDQKFYFFEPLELTPFQYRTNYVNCWLKNIYQVHMSTTIWFIKYICQQPYGLNQK